LSLIGDMIFRTRAKIPDLPPTLPTPGSAAIVVTSTGSTLPAGTYACVVTQRNPWGETIGAPEITGLVVGTNQGIQVASTLLPGAVAVRAYLTLANGAAGTEIQFTESTVSTFVISTPPTGYGPPPTRNSAYMMDSDGKAFSCAVLYDWMNEGLNKISRAVGGLLDYCGVPTVAGQPLYVLPGEWLEISDVWFEGYWVQGGKRGDFFRRNAVQTSVLSGVSVSIFSNQQVIEVSYQPDYTSIQTTTTAALSATATSIAIANTSFLLPFGFAQIGTEFVAYASLANGQMSGLIRGIGGSTAQAWPSGTVVNEMGLFWCGKRILPSNLLSPGMASLSLPVPQGWEGILPLYMLAQAKKNELDMKAAADLEKQCFEDAKNWMMANKGVVSQVQVNGYAQQRPSIFAPTIAGGVIIPGP
jgi:hypothetical protein